MVRRRVSGISNHETTTHLILRDAAKTPLPGDEENDKLRGT
jgi:hypothetical protein